MGLIPDNQHLTIVDPKTETARRRTWPGMAHWAATGPAGKTCRECIFWTDCGGQAGYYARRGMSGGGLKPRSCKKHQELMRGEVGNRVPHHVESCKYFEQNPEPPSLVAK